MCQAEQDDEGAYGVTWGADLARGLSEAAFRADSGVVSGPISLPFPPIVASRGSTRRREGGGSGERSGEWLAPTPGSGSRDRLPGPLKRAEPRGVSILRVLRGMSLWAELERAHDRLMRGRKELLRVAEETQGQPGTTPPQQLQAIGAVEHSSKALQEIGDFAGQPEEE